MTQRILLRVVLAVLILSLIGCQTIAGVGKDITWTAEATAEVLEGE